MSEHRPEQNSEHGGHGSPPAPVPGGPAGSAAPDHGHAAHDHGAHAHAAPGHGGHEPAHPAAGHGHDAHGHAPGAALAHDARAGHEAPKHDTLGRDSGVTMAGIGMLLALCSALVGATRTELIAAMVGQTNTHAQAQAVSTKHRVLQAQLQQLHSHMAARGDAVTAEAELARIESSVTAPQTARLIRGIRLSARNVLETVAPSQEDLDRFAWLVMKFSDQKEAAHHWAESYEKTIEAHKEGAEHYEWGQVVAEIGIVVASIAMLFKSRKVWVASLLFGLAALAIVITTWTSVSTKLHHAERETIEAERRYLSLSSERADEEADEELLKEIEGAR